MVVWVMVVGVELGGGSEEATLYINLPFTGLQRLRQSEMGRVEPVRMDGKDKSKNQCGVGRVSSCTRRALPLTGGGRGL